MSAHEVDLDGLIEAAGRSFGSAQQAIGLPEGMTTGMVISDAELDLRVGFRFEGGRLTVEPVSAASAARGGVVPEALSTIKVRYVAARSEIAAADLPNRTEGEVVGAVAGRADVAALAEILGELKVTARYVPDLKLWAARVEDHRGHTVRTLNLQDQP